MSVATYLYGVIGAPKKPAMRGVPAGVPEGSAVELAPLKPGVWLVSSEVPLDVYGPGRLEAALGDMDWVARIALAHEAVVEHFVGRKGITVVPMKLFTMFSTRERAVEEMTARQRAIDAALKKIAGAEEWGIRITRSAAGMQATAPAVDASSGAAFLAAKKQKRDDAQLARMAAAEAAVLAYERLASIASDATRRDDAPPAGATPPLLDAAFLVPSTRRRKFTEAARAAADACAGAGAQLTLSGPWPAYNFVRPDGER